MHNLYNMWEELNIVNNYQKIFFIYSASSFVLDFKALSYKLLKRGHTHCLYQNVILIFFSIALLSTKFCLPRSRPPNTKITIQYYNQWVFAACPCLSFWAQLPAKQDAARPPPPPHRSFAAPFFITLSVYYEELSSVPKCPFSCEEPPKKDLQSPRFELRAPANFNTKLCIC